MSRASYDGIGCDKDASLSAAGLRRRSRGKPQVSGQNHNGCSVPEGWANSGAQTGRFTAVSAPFRAVLTRARHAPRSRPPEGPRRPPRAGRGARSRGSGSGSPRRARRPRSRAACRRATRGRQCAARVSPTTFGHSVNTRHERLRARHRSGSGSADRGSRRRVAGSRLVTRARPPRDVHHRLGMRRPGEARPPS